MRIASLVSASLLAGLATTPAAAQISATIHVGPIRIGGAPVYADAYYGPPVVVVPYSARYYGHWRQTARYWRPVTLYLYGGRYYERPYRNARPVVVYRYRDQFFFAPHDRDWDRYRSRYEQDYWRPYRDSRGGWRDDWRNDRRDIRYDRRDDRRDNRADRRDDRRDDRRGAIRNDSRGRGAVMVPGRNAGRGAAPASSRARRRNN